MTDAIVVFWDGNGSLFQCFKLLADYTALMETKHIHRNELDWANDLQIMTARHKYCQFRSINLMPPLQALSCSVLLGAGPQVEACSSSFFFYPAFVWSCCSFFHMTHNHHICGKSPAAAECSVVRVGKKAVPAKKLGG